MVTRRTLLGMAPLLLGAPDLALAETGARRMCVVVGKDCPIEDISWDDLKASFLQRGQLVLLGQALIPLNQPAKTAARVDFDRLVLGMTPDQVADHWIAEKRRRAPGPPRSVPGFRTLRRVLERLSGTIGYLPPRQLTNQVKVLKLDGKYPESDQYRLRY